MEQKLYPEMSPEQQLQWVTDFEALMSSGGERIVTLARGRSAQWTAEDAAVVRNIVQALAVWPFATDFCEKACRYGDFMARIGRLPVYIDKVKERLADGLTMTDKDGRLVAYVSPSAPMRRRGRPSSAEVAARQRGETVQVSDSSPENEKRRKIAALLGLQVIVHGEAPREKNNAEIAAEKAARQAEYERQNPSLFDTPDKGQGKAQQGGTQDAGAQEAAPADTGASQVTPPVCPTMSEVYQSRVDQDRLRLADLAWLCSDELKARIPSVKALRVAAESASERAKTMAELGQPADAVAPYAQQAKEAVEGYMAIYAAVDEELAVQFKRLSIDQPYIEKFLKRFKGVDLEKVLHICRPYYEKVKRDDPGIDVRIKNAIETDNPEYAAKMKAEEEKKRELAALHRYIMRRDKDASDERVKTLTERIARIRELAGDEVADSYLPVLEKTKEDNKAWRKAKEADKATEATVKEAKGSSSKKVADVDKKPTKKKPSVKPAK